MPLALLKKPKSGALEPTVPIGQPMPQMQRIPEPVDMVGRYTGIRHAALGDGTSPETVQVVPQNPGQAVIDNETGEASYASGGIFSIGPDLGNPWGGIWGDNGGGGSQASNPWGIWGGRHRNGPDTGPDYGRVFPQGGMWNYDPQQTYGNGQQQSQQPIVLDSGYGQPSWFQQTYGSGGGQAAYAPSSRYSGDPTQALWQARNQGLAARYNVYGARGLQLGAQQNALQAGLQVLNAQRGTLPYQTAQRQAQSRAIDLSALRNQSQRGVVQQAGANDQARLGELQGIYAASQNTPDILRAAEAQQGYNAEDRRDRSLGVSAPIDVTLAPGQTISQPGTRAAIQTQEQALTRRAGYLNPIRQAQLAIAQNAVALQDTDVRAAELEAQRAGLSLAEARQLVDEAQINQGYAQNEASAAGLGVSQAQQGQERAAIDEAMAQQPPAPGLVVYTDPETGQSQWVTPDERNRLQAQYQYGPYGDFTRGLSQDLYARNPSPTSSSTLLTTAQIQKALRDGVIDENTARAYLQRRNPGMSPEDIDRLILLATSSGGGGYAPINP